VPEEVKVTGTVVENRENKEPPTASPMAGLQVTGCARELLPGFVLLPKVLSLELQQKLLDTACRVAAAPSGRSGGWYRCMPEPQLNDGNKARFWDQIDKFPPDFRCLGEQLALAAGRASPLLQQAANDFEPRVGALNFYTGKGRMNWHKDDYNFAKKDRPIVMASLGDTAEFGYKMQVSDPESSVHLESGDVIVFGGSARDLVHAMLRVFPDTGPTALQWDDALCCHGHGHRVSLTWRDVGVEDGLTFNSDERLGLTVSENTLPRYLPRSKGAEKGRSKGGGYHGYRK